MGEIRENLSECSLPAALEAMGERWAFLILRAAFNGLHHFEEFQQELGIARNILANRLARFVEHGILEPQGSVPKDWRFTDYELTLAKRAAKLRHDLELEWEGVALALELLQEVQQLRSENNMLRQRLGRFTQM